MQTQNRFRSWPLWLAIVALATYTSQTYFGYTIPGVDRLLELILPVVVLLGIINNPSDSEKF